MPPLSTHSLTKLSTVHPDMQKIVLAAAEASAVQIVVMQGLRTAAEELDLYMSSRKPPYRMHGDENGQPWKTNCSGYPVGVTALNGVAGTGVSNHQSGDAVDIGVEIDGAMVWDLEHYTALNDVIQTAASKLGLKVKWGGHFTKPDPDHFEIDYD